MTQKAMSLAACEINQILRYMDESEVNKIPLGLRLFFKDIADEKYIPDITPERDFEKQELLPETEQILGMIYAYYWSSEEEQNVIPQKVKNDAKKVSQEIFKDYSPEDFFQGEKERRKTELEEQALTSIPERESWYKRLFGWFKKK